MTATAAAQAHADPMLPRPFRVIGSRLDTDDTVTLSLEPLDGDPLEFEAGQFTMLHAFGVGRCRSRSAATRRGQARWCTPSEMSATSRTRW